MLLPIRLMHVSSSSSAQLSVQIDQVVRTRMIRVPRVAPDRVYVHGEIAGSAMDNRRHRDPRRPVFLRA